MYRWYSDARVCLVYLYDVLNSQGIGKSVWFERGWTLQELITPREVSFYNANWQHLGDKHELASTLSAVTRIPLQVLTGVTKPQTCSVAQRMSWAANRTTTRIEDIAYSLLGLFNINIAMIYGERDQAFVRLQEEIIKTSADQSIFAWNMSAEYASSNLLAPSVKEFSDCDDRFPTSTSQGFSIGNIGLSIALPTKPYKLETYMVALEVARKGNHKVSILLACLQEEGQYIRMRGSDGFGLLTVHPDSSWDSRVIHVR